MAAKRFPPITRMQPGEGNGKRFLIMVTAGLLLLVLLSTGIHVFIDVYGLFRPVKDEFLPVYHNERISKFLLAHRYIPENYNTLLIGTSLSDNLNISVFNTPDSKLRIYNASIMGGNISEISAIAQKAIDGGIKNIIFCISPYQMKNTGAKEVELNQKIYLGALGSKNLYETYVVGLIRQAELLPNKFPKKSINEDGVNHFTDRFRASDVTERILRVADAHRGKPLPIDPAAVEEFKAFIHLLSRQNIQYMGYFHPVPKEIFEAQENEFSSFQKMIEEILPDDRQLINFNEGKWKDFMSDHTNYIDNGHLSEQGQAVVARELVTRFEPHFDR